MKVLTGESIHSIVLCIIVYRQPSTVNQHKHIRDMEYRYVCVVCN